jgi:hypothetical protein
MKPVSRILVWLAVFLAIVSAIYMVTAREWTGGPLIASTATAFAFIGVVLWVVASRATRELEEEPGEVGGVELEHVGPTIWPAAFAVSAVILALGVATVWWLIIPGAIIFVICALGWFIDIRNQHRHAQHAETPDGAQVASESER